MADEAAKKLKLAYQKARSADQSLFIAQLEWAEAKRAAGEPLVQKRPRKSAKGEEGGAEAPAAAAVAAKPKAAKKDKAAAASAAPPKKQKKSTKDESGSSDWECAGNIITGDPHEGDSEAHKTRAPNTKHNGKTYQSCKACKRLIKAAKKVADKAE